MKGKMRLPKGTTTHYSSFEEAAKDFGCRPLKKKTDNAEQLKNQQEKFTGKCKICGHNLTYHYGTNALTCTNPECKGIKMSSKNEDGSENVWYIPVIRIVDDLGMEIGMNLFS